VIRSFRAFARRHIAVLVLVASIAWIIAITLLIITNPVPGGGSPV
jgi:hypothetical protein